MAGAARCACLLGEGCRHPPPRCAWHPPAEPARAGPAWRVAASPASRRAGEAFQVLIVEGRRPCGPGFRAAHRAAGGVSSLRASIPDACAPWPALRASLASWGKACAIPRRASLGAPWGSRPGQALPGGTPGWKMTFEGPSCGRFSRPAAVRIRNSLLG